jgi:hypothetical protein
VKGGSNSGDSAHCFAFGCEVLGCIIAGNSLCVRDVQSVDRRSKGRGGSL